ncbi:MAG: hypothetical protein ACTSYI_13175 [Promethearchaeota archaeon]
MVTGTFLYETTMLNTGDVLRWDATEVKFDIIQEMVLLHLLDVIQRDLITAMEDIIAENAARQIALENSMKTMYSTLSLEIASQSSQMDSLSGLILKGTFDPNDGFPEGIFDDKDQFIASADGVCEGINFKTGDWIIFTEVPLPTGSWNPIHFQSENAMFNSIHANEVGANKINSPNLIIKALDISQNPTLISLGTSENPILGVFNPEGVIMDELEGHIFPVKFEGDSPTVRKDFVLDILPTQNFHVDLWINLKDLTATPELQEVEVLLTAECGIRITGDSSLTSYIIDMDGESIPFGDIFQRKWLPFGIQYISGTMLDESGMAVFLNYMPLFGGKITGFRVNGDNTIVTCKGHGLAENDRVIISDSLYYDGISVISGVSEDEFTIPLLFTPYSDNYTAICSRLFNVDVLSPANTLTIGVKGTGATVYVNGIGFSHMNGYTPFSNSSKGLGIIKTDALEVDADSNFKGAVGVLGKNWAVNAAGIVEDFLATKCSIIEDFNGHKRLCKLQPDGSNQALLEYTHDSLQKFGLFGFFFCYSDISDILENYAEIQLQYNYKIDDITYSGNALELKFENGLIKNFDGSNYNTISSYSAGHLLYFILDFHATGIKTHFNGISGPIIPVLGGVSEINRINFLVNGTEPAYVDSVGISWLGFTSYRNITAGGGNFKGVFADEGVIKTLTTKHQIINAHGNFKISPHVLGKTWSQNALDDDGNFNIPTKFENWTILTGFEFVTAQIQYIKGNHKFVMFLKNSGGDPSVIRTALPEVDHTDFSFSSWAWPEIGTGGSIQIRLLDDGDNLIHSLKIIELDGVKQILFINYLDNSFFVSNINAEWFHLEFNITSDVIKVYTETNLVFEGSITSRPFSIFELQLANAELWLDAPGFSNLAYVSKSFENFADGIQTSKYQSARFQRVIDIQADKIKGDNVDWDSGTFRTLLPKTTLFNPNTPENVQNIQVWQTDGTGGTVSFEGDWKGIPVVANISKESNNDDLSLSTTFTEAITNNNGCAILIYIKESDSHVIEINLGAAMKLEIENLDLYWIGPDDDRMKLIHISANQWIHLAIAWDFSLLYASVYLNTKLIGGNLDWFDNSVSIIDQWQFITKCFESIGSEGNLFYSDGYSLYLAAPISPILGGYEIDDLWNNFSGEILPTLIGSEDNRIHDVFANQIDAHSYSGTFDGDVAVKHDLSFPKYTFEDDEDGDFVSNPRFISNIDYGKAEIVTEPNGNKCLWIKNITDPTGRQASCTDNFGKAFGVAMVKGIVKFKVKFISDIMYFFIRDSKNTIVVDLLTSSNTLYCQGNWSIGTCQKLGIYSFDYGHWYTLEFDVDSNLGYTLHITNEVGETVTFGENYALPLVQSGNGRLTNVKFATEYSPALGEYYVDDIEYKFSEFHNIPRSCSTVNEALYHLDQTINAHHWLTHSNVIKLPEGDRNDAFEWNIGKFNGRSLRGIFIKVLGHNLKFSESVKLEIGTAIDSITKTFIFDLDDCIANASLKQWTAFFCPIEYLSATDSNYVYIWKDTANNNWDGEVYFMEVVPLPVSDGLSSLYLLLSGGTLNGALTVPSAAAKGIKFGSKGSITSRDSSTYLYIRNAADSAYMGLAMGKLYCTGGIEMNGGSITECVNLTATGKIITTTSDYSYNHDELHGVDIGYVYSTSSYAGIKHKNASNSSTGYMIMGSSSSTYLNAPSLTMSFRIANIEKCRLESTAFRPTGHKITDLGLSGYAWDQLYYDTLYNQGMAYDACSKEELYEFFKNLELVAAPVDSGINAFKSSGLPEVDLTKFHSNWIDRSPRNIKYHKKVVLPAQSYLRSVLYKTGPKTGQRVFSDELTTEDKVKAHLKRNNGQGLGAELESIYRDNPADMSDQDLGYNPDNLLRDLTKAFSHSQAKIESLENENAKLKNDIEEIKKFLEINV